MKMYRAVNVLWTRLEVAVVAVLLCGRFFEIAVAMPAQETADSTEEFDAYVQHITGSNLDNLVAKHCLEGDKDVVGVANELLTFFYAIEQIKGLPNLDEVVKHYREVVTQFVKLVDEASNEKDNKVAFLKFIPNLLSKPHTTKFRCALNLFLFAWLTSKEDELITLALNVIFKVVTFGPSVAVKLKSVTSSLTINDDPTNLKKKALDALAKFNTNTNNPLIKITTEISIKRPYQAIRNAHTMSMLNLMNAKGYKKETVESAARGLAISCFSLFYYIDEIGSKDLKDEFTGLVNLILPVQKTIN